MSYCSVSAEISCVCVFAFGLQSKEWGARVGRGLWFLNGFLSPEQGARLRPACLALPCLALLLSTDHPAQPCVRNASFWGHQKNTAIIHLKALIVEPVPRGATQNAVDMQDMLACDRLTALCVCLCLFVCGFVSLCNSAQLVTCDTKLRDQCKGTTCNR